jgi:hypothetical protein
MASDASFASSSGKNSASVSVNVRKLGPLPIIRYFLDKLEVRSIIDSYSPKPNAIVSNGECIEALVMSIFLDKEHALSRVSAILSEYDLERLFRPGVSGAHFHDTRLGECLDDLYEYAQTIYGDLVAKAIRVFRLDLRRLSLDASKILLHGDYACDDDYFKHLETVAFPSNFPFEY